MFRLFFGDLLVGRPLTGFITDYLYILSNTMNVNVFLNPTTRLMEDKPTNSSELIPVVLTDW